MPQMRAAANFTCIQTCKEHVHLQLEYATRARRGILHLYMDLYMARANKLEIYEKCRPRRNPLVYKHANASCIYTRVHSIVAKQQGTCICTCKSHGRVIYGICMHTSAYNKKTRQCICISTHVNSWCVYYMALEHNICIYTCTWNCRRLATSSCI